MLFALDEEHRSVQDMARSFAAAEIAPFALQWDRDRTFPVDTLRRAAALGMAAVTVRSDVGGSDLSRLHAVIITEALAAACPAIAAYLSIHNMCAGLIDKFGTTAQRQRWLPALVAMDRLASYCLTEPGAGSDAAALSTRACRDGDDYVLDGRKQFISGAGTEHGCYLVLARTGGPGAGGTPAFIVDAGTAGLTFGPNEHKMGWHAQPTRAVILDQCRIPQSHRLGREGDGFKIAMTGLDGGRLNIAACSLGGAQSALEAATRYMSERHAFGHALATFQALQFDVADLATRLEAARVMLYAAAAAVDRGDADGTARVAGAKAFVTDTGFDVANRALQLFGGYGYLSEYGIEKLVRDLRVHQILEGTNQIMRLIVARHHFGLSRQRERDGS